MKEVIVYQSEDNIYFSEKDSCEQYEKCVFKLKEIVDRYIGLAYPEGNTDFKKHDAKRFPMTHKVSFSTPQKEIKFEMMLNYLGNEDNWETRTTLSGKYRQVEVDEILRRFMAL